MANLPMEGCVTQVSIMREVKNLLGLYLNQKDLKSGKKRLSFGHFIIGRLRDSSEYHRCSAMERDYYLEGVTT